MCFRLFFFFFSSRRRHTRCALVTGVQTCALPISDTRVFAQEPPEHAQREPVRGAGRGAGCYIMIAESPGDGGADIVRHSEQRRAEALDDLAPFVAELDFGDLRRMVRRCRIEYQRPLEAAPSHRRGLTPQKK